MLREHSEVLVQSLESGRILELRLTLGDRLLLALKQFLRGLAPRSEVVLVEHHEIPSQIVQKLVLHFDVANLIPSEQVLEGAEIDERLALLGLGGIAPRIAREVLPSFEIGMRLEIGLPRILDGGLEGHD